MAPLSHQGGFICPPNLIPFHIGICFIVFPTSYFKNGAVIIFQVAVAKWEYYNPPRSKVTCPQATVRKDATRSSLPPKWHPHLVDSSIESDIP